MELVGKKTKMKTKNSTPKGCTEFCSPVYLQFAFFVALVSYIKVQYLLLCITFSKGQAKEL
jgi:hypothetical protein